MKLRADTAIVAHSFWDKPGGGQLVVAGAVFALKKIAGKVVAVGITDFNPANYREWFNIELPIDGKLSLPLRRKVFSLLMRTSLNNILKIATLTYNPDIIFIDEIFYRRGRFNGKIIEYLHFPYELIINYSKDRYFLKNDLIKKIYYGDISDVLLTRYARNIMRIYWSIYKLFSRVSMRLNPFIDADIVITNSRWTAALIYALYDERPYVLNPPLPRGITVSRPLDFEERRDNIVMLGRFVREKRYHEVIEKIMPGIIKELPSSKLIIIGSAKTSNEISYLNFILRKATRKFKVCMYECNSNCTICIMPNASRRLINHVMDTSKVFLHATVNEHWGIAVAEAMARGLPVVVHRSGGTWTDLVKEGNYGLGWYSYEEAIHNIVHLMMNRKEWSLYSRKSLERVKDLDFDKFVDKLCDIIQRH